MNHWRMSFREGNGGYEMWPHCFKHGVAAISYEEIDDLDLSKYAYGDPPEKWGQLYSSQKASIRRVAYEMRKGDFIYVKQGPFIVGRGKVLGPYVYRLTNKVQAESGYDWPHQIPVAWESNFTPVRVLLGGELITVFKLTGQHLEQLKQKAFQTHRAVEVTEAKEGQIYLASVRFRRRNRTLVEAKRAKCAAKMRCELCGFSFKNRYGPSVREVLEVHHRQPVAETKGVIVSTIDDLILLCPNCHRVLHSVAPAMTVKHLKKIIR